ncbi:FAD-dependent monooxygenase [Mycobacterium sp. GA-2829]|uniref:FAD-dependent monooxygenase n=1 Tax=Mycobacterium sp. GA-2829 TaxID=1772283 RepID=UPI00073FFF29|nr:FAD-dependent monooxygenase [Mycobacterium sp. GA-2829]KUI35572.1 oxidoreductase [Mycobacterium sp. GA-2829]
MTTRSALISGASIAGPVLAYWLSDAGWDVTVVERADRLRTSGYPVDVRGTAVDVIRRMGLYDRVAAQRYRHVPVRLLSPAGHRLCTLDYGNLLASSDTADVELPRGALTSILHGATADRVEYVFGDTITDLSSDDDGVDVTFARRRAERFDVVIGADGIHSTARELVFGDEVRYLHHLGPYAAVWDLPTDMFDPGAGFFYSHPGRTVLVERPSDGGAARAFLTFIHPEPGTVDPRDRAEIVAALHDAFADDRWRTAEIIDTATAVDDVYFDTVSQVRMDRWHCGRVALVGDAAYAPSFLSGQGTSIAVSGAYVLASELAAHDRPQQAFAAYQQRMRAHVERNQALALRTDGTVLVRTRAQLLLRNIKLCAVPLLQRLGLVGLLQRGLRGATTDLTLCEAVTR